MTNTELESKTNQSILDWNGDQRRYMKRYDSFIKSKHNANLSYSKMLCCRYELLLWSVIVFVMFVLSWLNLFYLTLLVSMRELPVRKIYKIREWTEIYDTVRARLWTGGLINLINTDLVINVTNVLNNWAVFKNNKTVNYKIENTFFLG